jgi:nucleotide-binding universal stress UspA family protein
MLVFLFRPQLRDESATAWYRPSKALRSEDALLRLQQCEERTMPTIAVATDFSTRSDRALRRAGLLGLRCELDLLLIHAVDDDQPDSLIETKRDQAEELLSELQTTFTVDLRLRTEIAVPVGRPYDEIPKAAAAAGADLIVMGPHRQQLLRDAVRSTTVERVISGSPVPVLVANSFPTSVYKRALIATALDEASAAMVRSVTALPYLSGADFELLHVYDSLARSAQARSFTTSEDDEAALVEEKFDIQRRLQEFARECAWAAQCKLTARSARAPAGMEILTVAEEGSADLVVVARSEKGAIEAAFTGRASQTVLREASVDVLVAPGT